ncbi:hypothetical protein AB0D59_01305 [Streptomyces sp. NPDC048417]|uniref:hypothetical protein n=1 Tax=Streptomyces sp. NPDC048417 TaxID=3155387 RepID=UPI003446E2E1
MTVQTASRPWFRLDRHDVRSTLPAAIRAAMQNGLLDRVFQNALTPEFIFPAIADPEPWQGGLGDTKIMTRKGLIAPDTTPITGSDPSVGSYGLEQWTVTMDQYGKSTDTNMLQSKMTLASKYMADVQNLGTHAGQSLNRLARDKLYAGYAGGRTWCTTTGTSDTSIVVNSVAGFTRVLVNGVPTDVSAANPLNVTIGGVANTVTGVNLGTKTLTLGTARADVIGDSVVAANAPITVRPGTQATAYNLAAGNLATFAMFRAAVTRLRKMSVPTVNGNYVAHIDADTEGQLFADSEFKQLYQGRGDSDVYRTLSLGTFGGLDWVRNLETPTLASGTDGLSVNVHRPIVVGAGCLVAAPFEDQGALLQETGVGDVGEITMIDVAPGVQVARIIRPPQDRLMQVVSTSWAWTGDYAAPSDSLSASGDPALYKRAVVLEHSEN